MGRLSHCPSKWFRSAIPSVRQYFRLPTHNGGTGILYKVGFFERWHLRDFELWFSTQEIRPNLKRFFAFSNTPVGRIGFQHKKLRLFSVKGSKNDKIWSFLRKSLSHLCHFVKRWEKIWSKSWYHMASRDLSQGSGHRKFELSSLGMKMEYCPDGQFAIFQKIRLYVYDRRLIRIRQQLSNNVTRANTLLIELKSWLFPC